MWYNKNPKSPKKKPKSQVPRNNPDEMRLEWGEGWRVEYLMNDARIISTSNLDILPERKRV
jgi:hypothetical protein